MKKTLALVLAFTMIFSSVITVFADETAAAISADAQTCADLGILVGDGNGVTADYLAQTPLRIQAAIMFLRLKGLEAEAKAFTGTDNFADADQVAWAEGRAILAYLKAHPELGWQGNEGKFDPNSPVTAQQYYKVMLEALGYKQNTAEVVGDFAWENVLEFAAEKGLVKVADVANFTNNDIAVATVEALKAEMKEGGKTLVAALVEAGKISADKAAEAGLVADATDSDAKLDTVSAIGNAVVLVEFDADVDKAFAENVANYSIVEKGTDKAVEVTAAVADPTDATLVVLDTAALTAGKAYTMTVGGVSKNFAGVAKKTGAPAIDKVEGTDTERVVITFTTSMDMATALDAANYAISGVTVESVEWDDADGDRDAVKLTTNGLVANKSYKVTVSNVKSADGVVLKSASKNFVSKSDKKAPTIDSDKTKALTNTRILVTFKDDNEITAESAEDVANYTLKVGSKEDTLEIVSAKLVEDEDEDMKAVELTTAPQKGGQKYVLHVNNIVDTSVLANKMTKESKVNVYGKKVDEKAPTLTGTNVRYVSPEKILITFKDDSRLDFATLQDINNYSINNDIVVEKAELKDADDADCKSVLLTVSELGEKSSYKITVEGIADEYGNVMDKTTISKSYTKDKATAVSKVEKVKVTGTDKVEVYFTKELVKSTAQDVANYSINKDIGTPKKASYSEKGDTVKVTLTTPELTANKEYKLTIDGVEDIGGKVLAGETAKFVVSLDSNDIDAPEIQDVEVLNSKVIRVTFDETISNPKAATATIKEVKDDGSYSSFDAATANIGYEDNTIVEFKLNTKTYGNTDYVITYTDAKDEAGNKCTEDEFIFSATADAVEGPELLVWEQTSVRAFKLQYSEKVRIIGGGSSKIITSNGKSLTLTIDDDDSTIAWAKSSTNIKSDAEYTFQFATYLENYHGTPVQEEDKDKTVLSGGYEDEEEPYIEEVVATDRTHVKVVFNEDMRVAGTYKITYTKDDGKTGTVSVTNIEIDEDDNRIVKLTTGKLESKYVYTLAIGTTARDIAGNPVDKDTEFDFAGTDVLEVQDYVAGIKVINGTKFKLFTSKKFNPGQVTATVYADVDKDGKFEAGEEIALKGSGAPEELAADDEFTYEIANIGGTSVPSTALLDDMDYKVLLSNGLSYEITGIVGDDIAIEFVSEDVGDGTFKFSYGDTKAQDNVYVVVESTVYPGTIAKDGESVNITINATDYEYIVNPDDSITADMANVLVIRDNVVLYYKAGYALGELAQ